LFIAQDNGNVIDEKAIVCEHCAISVLNLNPSLEVIPIEKEKKKKKVKEWEVDWVGSFKTIG
jgi:H2-forming N5,N10-methylenetetrahydromethanopterin dehydrogenase-like enzyme